MVDLGNRLNVGAFGPCIRLALMKVVPSPDPGSDPRSESGEAVSSKSAEASRRYFTGWAALRKRVWGTDEFLRLWLAQVVTSIGEWVFFFVVAIKAADVGPGTPEGAVAMVFVARLAPGFFLGQLAGVLADRWDRRKLMAFCDIARAAVLCLFPFLSHVWQLVLLSLLAEAFLLLWMPAKEALVPNLIPRKHLPTANTLSVIATYGTFPIALLMMFALDSVWDDSTSIGFWLDSLTFLISAALILSIRVKASKPQASSASVDHDKFDMGGFWTELRDGWKVAFGDPVLRAINVGLAVGLVGGGMLVPLGTVYAREVLQVANRGYYAMLLGLGAGVVVGVLALLSVSERIDRPWVFGRAVTIAGFALAAASLIDRLGPVVVLLGVVGAAVGISYLLGFTIIQETVDDELRGRVFAAIYSLARAGLLVAMVAAPALAVFFDRVTELTTDGTVGVFGHDFPIPGVRLTFWLAALIIIAAGWIAIRSLRGVGRPNLQSVEPVESGEPGEPGE